MPVAGSGQLCVDNHLQEVKSGSLYYIPAGISHKIDDKKEQPLSLFVLCVLQEVIMPWWQKENFGEFKVLEDRRLHLHAELIFKNILYEQEMRSHGFEGIIRCQSMDILLQILRAESQKISKNASTPPVILSYIQYLEENFYRPLTLKDAAQSTGYSERRFSQLFREATSSSWLQYLLGLRIQYACYLLSKTNHTIQGVSFESGFEDLSHFYRCFKQRTGKTPRQWKERQLTVSE